MLPDTTLYVLRCSLETRCFHVHSLPISWPRPRRHASEISSPQFFRSYISLDDIYFETHASGRKYAIGMLSRWCKPSRHSAQDELRRKEWTITRSRRTDPQEFCLDLASGLIKTGRGHFRHVATCRVNLRPVHYRTARRRGRSRGELKIEKKQLSPAYCTRLVDLLCEQYANNYVALRRFYSAACRATK